MSNMVQYGMWGNCSNHCDFCLKKDKHELTPEQLIREIEETRKNISIIDWEGKFHDGISLLGGELFHIKDPNVQDAFMELIEDIIEKILKKVPTAVFSCVTNGIYHPSFLYRVMDRFRDTVGMRRVDIAFSYDLQYRFHTVEARNLVVQNILDFMKRYNHTLVVQMILTQHVINLCKAGTWSPNYFETEEIPGTILSFLYPHPIFDGCDKPDKRLPDFQFKRKDLFWFIRWLKDHNERCYYSFLSSTQHSGIYKYTGRFDKDLDGFAEQPKLTDGKEELALCGHSTLYRCYSDCDRCLECDLENLESLG